MSLICDTCSTSFPKMNPGGEPNMTILYEIAGPSHCCEECAKMGGIDENLSRGWFKTTVFDAYIREEEKVDQIIVQKKKFIPCIPTQELRDLAKEAEALTDEEWLIWDGFDHLKMEVKKNYRYVHENFKIGKPFRLKVDDVEIVIKVQNENEEYILYIDLEN